MFKLHFTQNTRAVRIVWLLEELGLPYELNKMRMHPSDLKSDQHRERHPLGRVPVLEDDDITIYESGAIVDYVLEKYKPGFLKPEASSREFPYYLQWFHYTEGMVMPPMNTIVVHTIILPEDRRDQTVLGQAQRLLAKSLKPVDQTLSNRDYLVGDFSAADIMLGHACFMADKLRCVADELTNLKRYIQTITERPAFKIATKA
tara:strand:- start:108 stop:716 length:609 start_codon:yes stop_codon:yes gene_type:complete